METQGLKDEMKAHLNLLRKGDLTEIDLDALGKCLDQAARAMDEVENEARSAAILKDDVVSEIVRLSRAASALVDGISSFDSGRLKERISACDTKALLALRKSVRAGFTRLLRSGAVPRKTLAGSRPTGNVADYKSENAPG